ncbi:unnamed protein product [Dimorphilus gyrociliatus]|uniref:Uncharacterized protein n=1 Tax=Dimorphilus gyrociliatus TaxID=2664684 RepID=A0A7I8VMK7_9ANNE|nr:unnamed protein product [Dimorphilus gyrociliatus]
MKASRIKSLSDSSTDNKDFREIRMDDNQSTLEYEMKKFSDNVKSKMIDQEKQFIDQQKRFDYQQARFIHQERLISNQVKQLANQNLLNFLQNDVLDDQRKRFAAQQKQFVEDQKQFEEGINHSKELIKRLDAKLSHKIGINTPKIVSNTEKKAYIKN